MNKDQAKSAVRWFVTVFGGFLIGWAVKAGLADPETIQAFLNSEWFIGIVATGLSLAWSMFTHTRANAVAAVAAIPDADLRQAGVAKILTAPTEQGRKLASINPGEVVAVAGNPSASTGVGRKIA